MGNQIIDVDFALHIPVDNFGNVGAPLGPAERGSAPHPAGHQLERTGRDFLSGPGDADDGALPPALVAAFQRLAHNINIADTLEAVIDPAAAQVGDRFDDVPGIAGVDEIGHAELSRDRLAPGIDIDADNLPGTDHARSLDHIQADPAEAEHGHRRTFLDPGGIDHRADPGGDPAADVADLVERRVLADFGERDFRQHGKIGERRTAHVMVDHLAVQRKTAGSVRHYAAPLRFADRLAQVGLA